MKLLKAITLSLGELDTPIITKYQLGLIIYNLYNSKVYKGEVIKSLQLFKADSTVFNRKLQEVVNSGVLSQFKGLPLNSVFSLLGQTKSSIEDIVCTIDPFCYVSHLSAMEHHGLTDRIPNKLFVSSPSSKEWSKYALEKMKNDLSEGFDEYADASLPLLSRTNINKISGKEIHRFSSVHLGAFKNIRGRQMRVSTLGRTFLDMLRNPELCGGINHVIGIYDDSSKDYLGLIVSEINQHGASIDKVRAGYILDERLGLSFDEKQEWLKFVQRGGSRKLDSSSEYEPVYSEKWCISLNIFMPARNI